MNNIELIINVYRCFFDGDFEFYSVSMCDLSDRSSRLQFCRTLAPSTKHVETEY